MKTSIHPQRIIIVGGVAGGASAAAKARRVDEIAELGKLKIRRTFRSTNRATGWTNCHPTAGSSRIVKKASVAISPRACCGDTALKTPPICVAVSCRPDSMACRWPSHSHRAALTIGARHLAFDLQQASTPLLKIKFRRR